MRQSLSIIFIVCALCCKCITGNTLSDLKNIELYSQDKPAEALNELASMDRQLLNSDKEKALYALLYSMALDKNYIDLKSDSLITPAVQYYSHTRDKNHKFLSYYYQARIYENAGCYDDALSAYMKAEQNICTKVPPAYRVRLYCGKERVYVRQFATDKALEEVMKARQISCIIEDPNFYINNCIDAVTFYHRQKKSERAKQILDSLAMWMDEKGVGYPSYYYMSVVKNKMYHQNASRESILDDYNNYKKACLDENRPADPLFDVDVLTKLGRLNEARTLFETIQLPNGCSPYDSLSYYISASELYRNTKEFDKYIVNHDKYDWISETMTLSVFNKDVRYLQERYKSKLKQEISLRRNIILSLIIVALVLSLITFIIIYARNKREYRSALEEALAEYSFFKSMFSEENHIPGNVRQIIQNHLSSIEPFLTRIPRGDISRSDLQRIKVNNQETLRSIALLYALSYPTFVSKLVNKGLDAQEIGLCSLYASGYVSKELSNIVGTGSIYRMNTSIRKKIGEAVNNQTLPSWLRHLLNSNY